MKVKELMNKLSDLDEDKEVIVKEEDFSPPKEVMVVGDTERTAVLVVKTKEIQSL